MKKRIFSVVLCLALMLSLLPTAALAAKSSLPFTDVESSDWYYDAVQYVYENSMMSGTGDSTFSPNTTTTRGMIVTVLHRLEGCPNAAGTSFTDVDSGAYYATAVAWASSRGIVDGYGNGKFGPNDTITREQMATILYRYAVYSGYDVSAKGDLSQFADQASVSSYAAEAMAWAVDVGLISGVGNNTLAPRNGATRAQVAAILMRFCENVAADLPLFIAMTYKVTFDYNYDNAGTYKTVTVRGSQSVSVPAAPSRIGYTFEGWYTDPACTNPYNFNSPIFRDITLYAKWVEASSPDPTEPPSESYTVTFYANAIDAANVPAAQVVPAGECASVPANPSRIGYSFDGWFTDAAGTTAYDFSTPVTSDISLYAKWSATSGLPDDVTDNEDTEVTDNDEYILTANTREVLAESNAVVTFYVNSTLTVPYFELYCDGSDTGVKLYDDGDYNNHKDDIPNDGCYTGTYAINIAEEKDVSFTASAAVGSTTVTTNEFEIFVYYEFTDEELALMEKIETAAYNITQDVRENMSGADDAAVIEAIRAAVDEYLQSLVDDGTLESFEYYPASYTYSWVYADTGVNDLMQIYSTNPEEEIKADSSVQSTTSGTSNISYSLSIDATYSKGNVVILNYYPANNSWSQSYDAIGKQLSDAGFSVTSIYDFTCADFKNLQKYNSMILVDSHGNTLDGLQSGKPMICTEEAQTSAKNKTYSTDIKKDRIEKITLTSGEKVYWIAPELFEFYYADDQLSSPIVYLGCCRNFPQNPANSRMVDALTGAGASSVCGYSSSVSVSYDNKMASTLVERLLLGDTVNEALSYAKTRHGQQDSYLDAAWNVHAQLNQSGNGNAVLYHPLNNGNFDSAVNLLGSGLLNWHRYGDARSIYKLSGINPISAPKMAIISSGFGSQNSETTSAIYQTFLVPENATTLSFTYDVVSEEPMEWVGTQYNDIFVADILSTDGTLLETLSYESINTSTWYAVDGINFPGGDDTTYHTRWQTVNSSAISKYRGQLVVLRFAVQDTGDAIYDTAALIDSVSVS